MAADILITLPIAALFVLIALRCLHGFGWRPAGLEKAFPRWASPAPPADGYAAPGWKVFTLALGLRVFLFAASLCWVWLHSGQALSLGEAVQSLCRWDAAHYINLAEQGYDGYVENGQHLFLVFYPAYVWLLRVVRVLIPHTLLAGMLLSSLCYAGGCCFVYRLARLFYPHAVARDGVLFLSLFPFSFFFGAAMTEGLFLLSTGAAVYYACRGKWLPFGLWGALAALTRMTGVLVLAPAILTLLGREKPLESPLGPSLARTGKRLLRALPCLLLPLLGTLGYLALNYAVDGDPFAFLTHQEHWYQGPMWVSQVLRYVWDYLLHFWNASNGWAIWLPTLLLFLVCFALLLWGTLRDRRAGPGLLAYGFCYLVANYSLSWLLSAGRYLSCGFVFFLLAASLTENRPNLRRGLLAGEAVLLGIYLCGHLSGAQIM